MRCACKHSQLAFKDLATFVDIKASVSISLGLILLGILKKSKHARDVRYDAHFRFT